MQQDVYRNLYGGHRALIERAVRRMHGEKAPDAAWGTTGWLRSLSIPEVVADALEEPLGADPYTYLTSLTFADLSDKLAAAQLQGLTDHIWSSLQKLKEQKASTGAALSSKFANEGGTFQMAFGSLSMFFGGLEGLIGPPKMVEGSLRKAIRMEHCGMPDSKLPFDTSNGMQGVTSEKELEFVVEPIVEEGRYAERGGGFRDNHPEWCRKPIPLSEFEAKMAEMNQKLTANEHTKMVIEELIGGRLYTGPMYEKLNAVLRFHSGERQHSSMESVPFLQKKCETLGLGNWKEEDGGVVWYWENNYATTIHAVNSCVLKLSKLTRACKVWRGFTGATLPPSFFEANEEGVRGGIEYGFSSTTVDQAQALHYAAGKASTVFEMEMGMIDRGADFSWLSQYPHEKEVARLPPTAHDHEYVQFGPPAFIGYCSPFVSHCSTLDLAIRLTSFAP